MSRLPKPAEGSWTAYYGLQTDPISYEDAISPEWYELEREAIFKRAWLNLGRIDAGDAKARHVLPGRMWPQMGSAPETRWKAEPTNLVT